MIREIFTAQFNEPPTIVAKAPGRINIIGEHTDYNEGFVLPAAINKGIYVAVAAQSPAEASLFAANFNEHFSVGLANLKPVETQWANYVLGVASELNARGYTVSGFKAAIIGDLPIGTGVSSSAAVECATVFALNELFGWGIDRLQMADIAQKAEHHFAGVNCGIMDMFASLMGKEGHAIKLDCRSLEYSYVPLQMEDYRFVLLNTNVKHSLAGSEYNTRRRQCEEGVTLISKHLPEVHSLRDVNEAMLDQYVKPYDALLDRRCRFVVQENARLHRACAAMQKNDLVALGKEMYASHAGLRDDYEVSCSELDYLVEEVRKLPYVLGARMMGGGFGGCTINLIEAERIDEVVGHIRHGYEASMQLPLTHYVVSVGEGTTILPGDQHIHTSTA